MAPRQSIAHARLMGAISHRRTDTSPVAASPPEPDAPEGFFVVRSGLTRTEHPGANRNGRPGSRGSCLLARAQERGACRRERGDEPDTDDRAAPEGFAMAAQLRRDKANL